MKQLSLILLLLAVCSAACKHKNAQNASGSTTASAYICPMDCEKGKTYPQPGTCPVCKMDLEAVAAAPAAGQDATAKSPAVQALEQETMKIHDEAMKEMADMNRVKREMKDLMIRAKMTPEGSQKFQQVLTDMDKAEEGMIAWMADYKEPVGPSEAEALKYLQEQKDKITKNQAVIRAALAAGQKLMG